MTLSSSKRLTVQYSTTVQPVGQSSPSTSTITKTVAYTDDIPIKTSDLTNDSGFITDHAKHKLLVNTPIIPAQSLIPGQTINVMVSLDGTSVATSENLTITPHLQTIYIPNVNDYTITIQKGGVDIDNFTTNANSSKSINIPNELPSYSNTDANKVLTVNSNGALAWMTPVGFESVSSQQDGTVDITLTNGDVITIDLNHEHPQYLKYVYCSDEAAYNAITSKEADTLYLIPESDE